MNIGHTIKILRTALDIKQKELSRETGIPQNSLSLLENGMKHPTTATIGRVCKAFNISEPLLHLLAIEEQDVVQSKRKTYKVVHESIVNLTVRMIMAAREEKPVMSERSFNI